MAIMDKKMDGNSLGTIQRTMLIPLYFRAEETRRPDAIIHDWEAVRIIDQLGGEFAEFQNQWNLQVDIAVRTEIFDEVARDFLHRYPRSIVVNLGSGLDARFSRVDNGQVLWFHVDMPDAIAFRHAVMKEADREHCIAGSAFDREWIDVVLGRERRPTLIIAEGFLCYFEEAEVRRLFAGMADAFSPMECAFQTISSKYVGRGRCVPSVHRLGAEFLWGVRDLREIEAWDPRYRIVQQWSQFDRHKKRWRHFRYWAMLPWIRRSIRETMQIGLLKVVPDAPA